MTGPVPAGWDRRPTGSTAVAAVVGDPVDHSLSPSLHNAAFASAGLDWVFVALRVPADDGEGIVAAARVLGLQGLAVTMPHKEAVAATVDEVDPAAAALRSCNTVVRRPGDRMVGTSTDGAGFVASLRASGHDPTGARVVVVGAGAAARSLVDALGRAGAADVAVVNRTHRAAVEAAALTGTGHAVRARPGSEELAAAFAGADLVVNATSVGMGADPTANRGPLPFDVSVLHAHHVVADLVYHPLDTALLRAARAAGAAAVDGLGMLVHQAALQQQLWTGVVPDVDAMRAAATAVLEARRR